ncbi:hypothetical protein [Bosea vaviloviae]|uniref:Integrase n=1 Tax=Bosea vaviloviae TaxID=1526658 RepID=A0A1D7U2L3_9HYPH|nr:hypothetical protein [Bosea vaviloviae]AOO81615.1 hypothetical protein BHK69_15165 [Bosea vaviloviae]
MQRVDLTTVLVVPWYERKDFERMRLMSPSDGLSRSDGLPISYEAWLDSAFRDMRQLLARGCALKIVTVHLDDYLTWLASEAEADTAAMRSRYVRELSTIGSRLDGPVMRNDASWSGFLPH